MHGLDVIKVLNARAAGKEAREAYLDGNRALGADIQRANVPELLNCTRSCAEIRDLDVAFNRALQGQV